MTLIFFQKKCCTVEASVDEFPIFKNQNNQRKTQRK